jgi:hypothetical protein
MRIVFVAQVTAFALLVGGCPNAPTSDPSGGNSSAAGGSGGKGEVSSSSTGTGGKGGEGGKPSGSGGSGAGGAAGSGGSAGSGSASGGAGGTAGSGAGGSGTGGSPTIVCSDLLPDLNAKQDDATNCNIELGQDKQCGFFIDGLCCPIAVSDVNSPDVIAYLAALKAYLDAGCVPSCPPVPCPVNPGVKCVGGVSGADCVVGP